MWRYIFSRWIDLFVMMFWVLFPGVNWTLRPRSGGMVQWQYVFKMVSWFDELIFFFFSSLIRLFADVLNDIAMFIEILAPYFPVFFTLIMCVSGVFKVSRILNKPLKAVRNQTWDNQRSVSSPVPRWSRRRGDQGCSDCSSGSQRQHGWHLCQGWQSGTLFRFIPAEHTKLYFLCTFINNGSVLLR